MSAHTEGRLEAGQFQIAQIGKVNYHGIAAPGEVVPIAVTGPTGANDAAIACADARRLAACWNAFEGIETERFEGKTVSEYVTRETYLTGMEPNGGGMDIGLKGIGVQMVIEALAGQFKGNGAVNFLEVRGSHPDTGPIVVTIQRLHGETPSQQKAAAIAERDQLRAENARLAIEIATALAAVPNGSPFIDHNELVRSMAEDIVRVAGILGVVLTITQVPSLPPAMGNYETVVQVRAARERA